MKKIILLVLTLHFGASTAPGLASKDLANQKPVIEVVDLGRLSAPQYHNQMKLSQNIQWNRDLGRLS